MDRAPSARIAAVVTAFALAAAAGGCGSGEESGPTSSAATTTPASTPSRDPEAAAGRMFTADTTIVGARPIPFTTWTLAAPDRVAVGFQTGSPECYGVDARVTESDKAVTIEIRSGTKANAVGRMCTMVAVFGTLEVPLKAPLGDRMLLSAT
ncbi:hypothetical protein [Nocardia bovistercoris]|uniref:Large secreted protein n=1 Tax=Nocardia bovistercoris TaxID=2785916 RepID=A0A931IA97_9NOCA|nr:hypothetical protein [Nocardia bovistercoris]MBH0776178.1 hypothetical protein [Nocardia bovistercoris]